ncbi:MAG: acylphosphatase, partial [Synergistales bacterium]|nr:acylphosphatase [Synergistales bacterium]
VEALLQGGEKELKNLLSWCRSGPPLALVMEIREEWEEVTEKLFSFEVLF